MEILIVYPAVTGLLNGNEVTAKRWSKILEGLGHHVDIVSEIGRTSGQYQLLIALHAVKSGGAIELFRNHFPKVPIIVATTGTDIYGDPEDPLLLQSLKIATRIVVLQDATAQDIPAPYQEKTRVIFQSITATLDEQEKAKEEFAVCIVGNLRDPKDPFLTAAAVGDLPQASRIAITHIGDVISQPMRAFAMRETTTNPRYRWIGGLSHRETIQAISRSHLMVNSSKVEGGSAAISEAIAIGTPVLATRIAGNRGLLGDDYDGLFDVGQSAQLRTLLLRAEEDEEFLLHLRQQCEHRRHLIAPATERERWSTLIQEIK